MNNKSKTTTKYLQLDDVAKQQIVYADKFFDEVLDVNISASQLIRYLLDEFIEELDKWCLALMKADDSSLHYGLEKLRRDIKELRKTRTSSKVSPEHIPEMSEDNPMTFKEWIEKSTNQQ